MQRKGSISWSFSESRPQLPHAALFIRDAARLVVPTRASIPPRMSGELPDRSSVADDAERRAGEQWASWWRDIVKRAFQQVGLDPPARLDSGMDDRLSLQPVVRELSDEAYRWGNRPNHKADHGPGNFDGAMLARWCTRSRQNSGAIMPRSVGGWSCSTSRGSGGISPRRAVRSAR